MSWIHRALVGLTAGLLCVSITPAQEPAAKAKVKVEFRWLESKPIPDVTTTGALYPAEDDTRLYPHKKAVVTNEDITKVRISEGSLGWSAHFHLTPQGLEKLAQSSGGRGKMFVITIQDFPWGYPYYSPRRDRANFVPMAGFFTKDLADAIAETFPRATP